MYYVVCDMCYVSYTMYKHIVICIMTYVLRTVYHVLSIVYDVPCSMNCVQCTKYVVLYIRVWYAYHTLVYYRVLLYYVAEDCSKLQHGIIQYGIVK